MNKDMINIDDFVREKLNGHPAQDDSAAAWLKMKDLLDKEKPEKIAPFMFRWRKPMAFLGAAILLSALCVGGYELINTHQSKNIDTPVLVDNNNNNAAKNNNSNINESKPSSNQAPIINAENTLQNTNITNTENNQQPKSNNLNKSEKAIAHATNGTPNKQNESVLNSNNNKRLSIQNNVDSKPEQQHLASNSKSVNEGSNTKNNADLDNKNINKNATKLNYINNSNPSNIKTLGTAANKTATQNSKDEFASNKNTLSSKDKVIAKGEKLKENNSTTAKNEHSVIAQPSVSDSIPATTIVTKEKVSKGFPRKTISKIDTIASGKIALPVEKSIDPPTSSKEQSSQQSKTLAAQQNKKDKIANTAKQNEFAATAPSSANNKIEQNNTTTVAKKEKSKAAKWFDNLNLPQAAADAKKDMANAKFYAGFEAGANYSLANNNFQGVQFGPTGELVFNKHWSLFGAIKYFNRSGGKKTVNDSYAKEIANSTPDSTVGANWYYKVHTDSTNRFFNFSTLHSFELPVTIRYAFKKFYVMTGINLAYYLGVNVEEVQKNYSPVNLHWVQTNATKPILKEAKPKLATTDFGSKFGIGYVVGAGYQISPAWQTDIRIVNTFWDNAKGDGAQKLSKDFYKLPSLQISVGYQFNRGKKKATFGPTDTQ